jgi:hypothetical protein
MHHMVQWGERGCNPIDLSQNWGTGGPGSRLHNEIDPHCRTEGTKQDRATSRNRLPVSWSSAWRCRSAGVRCFKQRLALQGLRVTGSCCDITWVVIRVRCCQPRHGSKSATLVLLVEALLLLTTALCLDIQLCVCSGGVVQSLAFTDSARNVQ